jgi:hypothetical protein
VNEFLEFTDHDDIAETEVYRYRIMDKMGWRVLVQRRYHTISKRIDAKYERLREQAEMKEEVGWVRFRQALQGVE